MLCGVRCPPEIIEKAMQPRDMRHAGHACHPQPTLLVRSDFLILSATYLQLVNDDSGSIAGAPRSYEDCEEVTCRREARSVCLPGPGNFLDMPVLYRLNPVLGNLQASHPEQGPSCVPVKTSGTQ